MRVITKFDPWNSPLCTCPEKYSLNPYTGCSHGCIYCYATYIPDFFRLRRKKNLLKRLRKDLGKLPENSLISMSNSSDPYPPEERIYKDTRKCLKEFENRDLRILIVTKSNLVTRDLDILKRLRVAVTFTVTTMNEELSKKLEPNAPLPQERIDAMRELSKEGIRVGLRLDPVFPFLSEDMIDVIREAKRAGAEHVVTSTFKPRIDGWKRFEKAFPEVARKLKEIYFKKGEKIGNSWYLPAGMRREIIESVKKICEKYSLSFASCREGFQDLNTASSCDGSYLIPNKFIFRERSLK